MAYNVDDLNKILADINSKIDALADESSEKSVLIESMKNAFDNKSSVEIERIEEFSNELNHLKYLLETFNKDEDYSRFISELQALEQSFKNEIMNMSFDRNSMLADLKDDIVKLFEKITYFSELYPDKSAEKIETVKNTLTESLAAVQQDINGHIKADYEMLAQALGALYGVLDRMKKEILESGTDEIKNISQSVSSIYDNTSGVTSKISELQILLNEASSDRYQMLQLLMQANTKASEISDEMKTNFSKEINGLKMSVAMLSDKFYTVKEEIKHSSEDNLSQILSGIQNSSALIKDFKENISDNLAQYLSSIKEALADFSDEIKDAQENFGSDILDKKSEEFQKLSEEISKLDENLTNNDENYREFVNVKLDELNSYITGLKKVLSSYNFSLENSFIEKFASLENIINEKSSSKDEKLDTLEKTLDEYSKALNNHFVSLDEKLKNIDENFSSKTDILKDVLNSVSVKTDEISLNVRMNLSNQIEELKTDIAASAEKIDTAKFEMQQNSNNNVAQIMTGLRQSSDTMTGFREDVSNHLSEYLSAIKDALETFSNEITASQENLSSEIFNKKVEEFEKIVSDINRLDIDLANKDDSYRLLVDEKVEELHSYLVALEDMISSSNIGLENSLSGKISVLEDLISLNSSERNEKIDGLTSKVEAVSQTLDDFSGKTDEQINNIREIKSLINSVFEEIQKNREGSTSAISDFEQKSAVLENSLLDRLKDLETQICEKTLKHKSDTIEKIDGISNSILEIKTAVQDIGSDNLEKINNKLAYLESGLNDNFSSYGNNLTDLEEKVSEYISSIERVTADTDLKLENSLSEITDVKNELKNIYEKFEVSGLEKMEGFSNHFDGVMSKFSEISDAITTCKSDLNKDITSAIQSNIDFIDKGLEYLSQSINEIKENQPENSRNFVEVFDEKVNEIKQELSFICTDITQAVNEKNEKFLNDFSPLKDSLDKLMAFNFENIVEEIKNQVQLSYLNLLSELNDNLTDNYDAYVKIESTYKDIISRCESLEQTIGDFTRNNMDLLNNTVSDIESNVCANLDKTNSFYVEWKSSVEELNARFEDNQKIIEHSFVNMLEKIDKTLDEKLLLNQKTLQDYISTLVNDSNFVQLIENTGKDVSDKIEELRLQIQKGCESYDNVHEIVDTFKKLLHDSVETLSDKFFEIEQKFDIFAKNDNLEIINEISQSSEKVIAAVDDLSSKLGVLSADDTQKNLDEINSGCEGIQKSISELHSKVDILAMSDDTDNFEEVNISCENIQNAITELKERMDVLVMAVSGKGSDNLNDFVENIQKSVAELNAKVDILAMSDNTDITEEISYNSDKLMAIINELHAKVDVLAAEDNSAIQDDIDEIKNLIQTQQKMLENSGDEEVTAKLEDILQTLDNSDDKIAKTLELLHNKVDILAMVDDNEIREEIQDIKDLIIKQKEFFENNADDKKSQEISSHLQKLIGEITKIEKNVSEIDLDKNSQDIKDSVMTAILSAMDQVSFVEETEEIKDFVEEKTNAINQTLLDVKRQLSNITNTSGDMDFYTYSLQDVEADLAKLRLALNEISSTSNSNNEVSVISANISRMAKSIEQLQMNTAADNSVPDLKSDFDKLSEDIISLSTRTNKILLNYEESQRVIKFGLDEFARRTQKMQERLNELDNKEVDKRLSLIEGKIDETVTTSNILRDVMMYLGEWMDDTSETISSIYDKTLKAASTHDLIENLKLEVPEQTELLNLVESRFEEQESRIDRLEQKLEKALEMLSEYDENVITTKIDRIDKHIGKLTENIEKLTAYVDEE